MTNYLYVLSEHDNDETIYHFYAEKIAGFSFQSINFRRRRGSGISGVRRNIRLLLDTIKHTGKIGNVFCIIAIDNDRSQEHPDHPSPPNFSRLEDFEQNKPCRFCELERMVYSILGEQKDHWPMLTAIAVPVQMIESWLLLTSNSSEYSHESLLPLFGDKTQAIAIRFYQPHPPPDQLKDLVELELRRLNLSTKEDYILYCVEHLVPSFLVVSSQSFQLFKTQIDTWI